eukprot:scaffold194306_cov33-Tisochrysis_lutea.AAC.1
MLGTSWEASRVHSVPFGWVVRGAVAVGNVLGGGLRSFGTIWMGKRGSASFTLEHLNTLATRGAPWKSTFIPVLSLPSPWPCRLFATWLCSPSCSCALLRGTRCRGAD